MGDWMKVARLVRAKTLQGGLVVQSTSGLPFLLHEGMEVVFVPPLLMEPKSALIESISQQDESSALVVFKGVCSKSDAEQLVGRYCLVRRAELDNESPQSLSCEGFEVWDAVRGQLGRVVRIETMPTQDLLVVEGPSGEILIPAVDAFIAEVNPENARINVSIPEGLLTLNSKE